MSQISLFAPLPEFNGAAPAVTAPSVPGQVVGHPSEPCFFPQPEFYPPVFLSTGANWTYEAIRPEFKFDTLVGVSGIDAPTRLPAGGHRVVNFGRIAIADAACWRA